MKDKNKISANVLVLADKINLNEMVLITVFQSYIILLLFENK